jgi:transcriptional regulator with XRE-family HTH domain
MLWIEYARRRNGWSQTDLKRASGVNQPLISLAEQGRGIPRPDQLARLARALEVPVELLLKPVELDLPKTVEREEVVVSA